MNLRIWTSHFLAFSLVTLFACNNPPKIDSKFIGVWLPTDGQSESKGLILGQGGTGSFTSRAMLEKYPNYRQAFNYRIEGNTIYIDWLGDEGESSGWLQSDFTLTDGELKMDQPLSPLTFKRYRRVRHD